MTDTKREQRDAMQQQTFTPAQDQGNVEHMTAQPVPQPQPQPQAVPEPPQLNFVPAIQGVNFYYAIGSTQGGPQLYSYDVNLKQWRIAQDNEMERVMASLGVPPNVLAAMKNFRM